MKKLLVLSIAATLCLSTLNSCGVTDSDYDEEKVHSEFSSDDNSEEPKSEPFDIEMGTLPNDQDYMKNMSLYSQASQRGGYVTTIAYEDNWYYCIDWDDNGNYQFLKVNDEDRDSLTILEENVVGEWLVKEDYIYYTVLDNTTGTCPLGIYKMKVSGSNKQCLLECENPQIQIWGHDIYFTGCNANNPSVKDHHLYKMNLDGSEIKELMSKKIYWWHLFDNCILYQDDADGESLHATKFIKHTDFSIDFGEDIKINNQRSYSPIFDGEYIYYVSPAQTREDACNIWRIKPDGTCNEMISDYEVGGAIWLLSDNKIYYVDLNDDNRVYSMSKTGTNISLVYQSNKVDWINVAAAANMLSLTVRADDDTIEKIVILDTDGEIVTTLN